MSAKPQDIKNKRLSVAESAEKVIANDPSYYKIDLSYMIPSWTGGDYWREGDGEHFKKLAKALKTNQYVNEITFWCSEVNVGEMDGMLLHLFDALKYNKTVTVLKFASSYGFKEDDVLALCEALRNNNTLEELHLNSCNLTPKFVSLIFDALKNNTSLKRLHLTGNKVNGIDAANSLEQMLRKNTTLEYLGISACEIDINVLLSLALGLSFGNNKTLTGLDIGSNAEVFEIESAMPYVVAIVKNSSLTSLCLAESCKKMDLVKLFQAFKSNSTIDTLWLHGAEFNEDSISALGDMLSGNETLKELVLYGSNIHSKYSNYVLHGEMTDERKQVFTNALGNFFDGVVKSCLTKLNMGAIRYYPYSAEEVQNQYIRLLELDKFESLDLVTEHCATQFSKESATALAYDLEHSKKLTQFRASIKGSKATQAVVAACMSNQNINDLQLHNSWIKNTVVREKVKRDIKEINSRKQPRVH